MNSSQLKPIIIVILFFIVANGCHKDNSINLLKKSIPNVSVNAAYDIDLKTALNIASAIQLPAAIKGAPPIVNKVNNRQFGELKLSKQTMTTPIDFSKKQLRDYFSLKNSDGNTSMYVFNYLVVDL